MHTALSATMNATVIPRACRIFRIEARTAIYINFRFVLITRYTWRDINPRARARAREHTLFSHAVNMEKSTFYVPIVVPACVTGHPDTQQASRFPFSRWDQGILPRASSESMFAKLNLSLGRARALICLDLVSLSLFTSSCACGKLEKRRDSRGIFNCPFRDEMRRGYEKDLCRNDIDIFNKPRYYLRTSRARTPS